MLGSSQKCHILQTQKRKRKYTAIYFNVFFQQQQERAIIITLSIQKRQDLQHLSRKDLCSPVETEN
jgi:hypothetical protein